MKLSESLLDLKDRLPSSFWLASDADLYISDRSCGDQVRVSDHFGFGTTRIKIYLKRIRENPKLAKAALGIRTLASESKARPTRKPSHPGEILKDLWLSELGYTQSHFAEQLVSASKNRIKKSTMQTKLNEVISGKRAMSADFAVLISKVLKTNPRMWMNLQTQLDIWLAEEKVA